MKEGGAVAMKTEPAEDRLLDLLERWEALREQGREPTPEELCADSPECLELFKRHVAGLRRLDEMVESGAAGAGPAFAPSGVGSVVSYEDLRFLAAGGLGSVFKAREAGLGRGVALKFVHPARASDPNNLRRFRREVLITAMLEHPGIVPIYSQGRDAEGNPCYAMRFIEGEDLAKAIERFHEKGPTGRDPAKRAAEFRALLGRFRSACATLAYAHSRGVVHRDVKPANIMLGDFDATMVVDWGLALTFGPTRDADLDDPSADAPDETGTGPGVGTPGYMAPEQCAGTRDRIDGRSDVYSLGATLYAILTGRAPLSGVPPGERARRAAAGDVPRPRAIEPSVPAALEAVCLKAMATAPEDRYPTAEALSADIEKWLADESIDAYRETLPVRARRWMKRHRSIVTAAGAATLIALVGLAALGVFQDRANRSLRAEVARTQLVNRFLMLDLLGQASPEENERASKITVEDLLDKAAEKIGARFAGQPDLEAGGRAVLGQTYNRLGQFQKAEAMIRTALPLYLANRGEDHPDTLELRNELANALSGLGSDAEAIQVYRDLIPRCDRVLAPDDTLRAATRSSLGAILRRAGRLDEAESLLREALDLAGRFAGDATETRLGAASNLALLLEERGRADQAEPLLLESWKAYEGGNEHPSVLVGAANYANLIAERGEFDRAVPMLERLVESHRRVLGTDHAGTLGVTGLLAGLMVAADRFERAEALFRSVMEGRERTLGPDHPDTIISRRDLGDTLVRMGRVADGLSMLQQTLDVQRRTKGERDPETLLTLGRLATALEQAGRPLEAVPMYREALEGLLRLGKDPFTVLQARNNLANGLSSAGELEEAQLELRPALAESERLYGPEHPMTLTIANNLAMALRKAGALIEAADVFRGNLERCRRVFGPTHSNTISSTCHFLSVLSSVQLHEEADRVLDRALAETREAFGPDHPKARPLLSELVFLRIRQGKAEEAVSTARSLVEGPAGLPRGSPERVGIEALLGWALLDAGRVAEAEGHLRPALMARREQLPPGDRLIANAESLLGACLTALGRYDEAEPLLLDAHKVLAASPVDRAGGQTRAAVERIITHYLARDMPDKAEEWRAKP